MGYYVFSFCYSVEKHSPNSSYGTKFLKNELDFNQQQKTQNIQHLL